MSLRLKTFLLLLLSGFASSGYAASVTLVPTSNVTSVIPGAMVTLDIVIDFAGESTMGGGIDITFDPTALQFVSFNRNPSVGEADFSRDPDELPGLLGSWAIGAFGAPIPDDATLGSVSFQVLVGIGPTTVVAVTAASGIGGPWVSGTDYLTIIAPIYNPVVVHFDTDGDGTPNVVDDDDDNDGLDDVAEIAAGTDPLDPDSDDDGLGDAVDPDPLVTTSNDCTGDNATVAASVSSLLVCAANVSVDVQGSTQVAGPNGHLYVITPSSGFQSGFRVFDGGSLTVITAIPCPGCSP